MRDPEYLRSPKYLSAANQLLQDEGRIMDSRRREVGAAAAESIRD